MQSQQATRLVYCLIIIVISGLLLNRNSITSTYTSKRYSLAVGLPLQTAADRFEFIMNGTAGNLLLGSNTQTICKHIASPRVAVVGNGPISEEQRKDINTADTVVRFNRLGATMKSDDSLDVWFTRQNNAKITKWSKEEGNKTLIKSALLRTKLFIRIEAHAVEYQGITNTITIPEVEMEYVPFRTRIRRAMQKKSYKAPSTGLMGLLTVLGCYPGSVDVYGFNWSNENHAGHFIDVEEEIARRLEALGKLVIHPTPCDGYRECV